MHACLHSPLRSPSLFVAPADESHWTFRRAPRRISGFRTSFFRLGATSSRSILPHEGSVQVVASLTSRYCNSRAGNEPTTMTWQRFVGSLSAASSIGAAAYGSHGLSKSASEKDIKSWDVATRYQMAHSMALVALPAIVPPAQRMALQITSLLFASGIALFSGSIYGKILLRDDVLGTVTPYGGGALILGWVSLAVLRR